WAACRNIPLGETRTYAELASMAGTPKAARAAGSAMRNNPMSLITPCHRVVAASDLGGYAGDRDPESVNLSLKSKILRIEQCLAAK
ncbi:MAG: MGMT family protein, partial [Phycisphaerae bacterium]|nr:MGMT family protein [Phycisphaerae bacterium]